MTHINMRYISILLFFSLLGVAAMAAPIDKQTALTAGTHFMQRKGLIKSTDHLIHYEGLLSANVQKSLYIFNVDTVGFVIVSADDRCVPIIGYSMNGSFDSQKAPTNMMAWLEECSASIQAGILANAPDNKEMMKQWDDLLQPSSIDYLSPKSDSYLLTSTWEQGSGYNKYCPKMNGQPVVVGCVATAMAQIIRYHGKPTRGFGRKTYRHSVYGILAVDFDTTDYDFSLMPDKVRRSTPENQRDMVSRLCYHCGIVVNMEYQHAGHTTGSGAHTSDVPEGLLHFGYTDAKHYSRLGIGNDSLWAAMIRNEIDNRRPIEYSGYDDEGGHAFVLDGYNNQEQYHFNWGWGGYADGFYSLSTMMGFTSNQEMVINIYPSGWDGHLTHFLTSPDGTGDGTDWDHTNSNINAALRLNRLVERDIWLKEGIYYGDTNSQYAYELNAPATIHGGFAGTETMLNERDAANHPAIFDGLGRHSVLYANPQNNGNRSLKIYDIIVQNGYSPDNNVVSLNGDVVVKKMTIRNSQSDSGSILYASYCNVIAASIHGNQAPTACHLSGAALRQSLVYNNDGDALKLNGSSRVINCDIVSNKGTGAVFKHPRNSFINNIVWNNAINLRMDTTLSDTSFRHCAIEGESMVADSTCIWLNSNNEDAKGPRFIQPTTTRGVEGFSTSADWHLGRRSVCIDAGEKVRESLNDGDYDQALRSRNGFVDLGCYESNYPVGIDPVATTATLNIHPNPAHSTVTVSHCTPGSIQIFDMSGREVFTCQATTETVQLDIRQLPQGVYFLKIGAETLRLVKR